MVKKRVYSACLILILFGFGQRVYSQRFSPDFWHSGGVVLKSGDTLSGKVYYSLEDNSVQLAEGDNKHFYKAFNLESVFFENATDSTLRTFHVYDYEMSNGYQVPHFFEILYQDSLVSLLGRERLVFFAKGGGFQGEGVGMGFDFFLKFKDGRIVFLPSKKNDIIDVFPDQHKQLENFIKERKSDFNSLEDVKEVVAFYNLTKQI